MPAETKTPRTSDRPMDSPLVAFFSARDCSFWSGLMRFCAKPIATAERPARSGMTHEAPPSATGTMPRNSVPGAPPSVTEWMTSTRPNRMTIWTKSGTIESNGW